MSSKEERVSYIDARKRSFVAATTVRIFGVPLHEGGSRGHRPIWWCGIGMNGAEHREGSHRIWHIPESDIVESGEASEYTFEGHQVHWFDVKRDCTPVEETLTPVSLAHNARMFLARRGGGFGRSFFPGWWTVGGIDGGDNPIPVTIEPGPTTGPLPTGQPPTTLEP